MTDEFDDLVEPSVLRHAGCVGLSERPPSMRVGRLVSRLYLAARPPLRAALLACLLRPLGTLGLVAVAAGAFAGFLHRSGAARARAALDDVAQFSSEQLIELANFVEQVSPEALQEFAKLIVENPFGVAAFSASAAVLLMHSLRDRGAFDGLDAAGPIAVPHD